MNAEQFCYWLKGYFDISETSELTQKQAEEIKKQLNTTLNNFNKVQVHLFNKDPALAPQSDIITNRMPF